MKKKELSEMTLEELWELFPMANHRCPQKAIVYLDKKSKYRYVNPNVKESEIGKDF